MGKTSLLFKPPRERIVVSVIIIAERPRRRIIPPTVVATAMMKPRRTELPLRAAIEVRSTIVILVQSRAIFRHDRRDVHGFLGAPPLESESESTS